MAYVNETIHVRDEPQGIDWRKVTFNPKASFLGKIVSYATLGFVEYKHPHPILHNVYGSIKLGEMVALMGPSGAGKSSLMKCLTDGICYSGFTGTISSRGIQEEIRTSIIHQDEKEHLILGLTVRETLMYASQLKNRSWCPQGGKFHEDNVNKLLLHLGLDNKAENPVSKCSGGERKRIAIGVELTEKNKPHILFLDEPTTGLDSSVAYSVIKTLKRFATINNMAIISTIHQPSQEILNVFDKAIMLTGTGAILYHDNPSVDNLRSFLSRVIPDFEHRGKRGFIFENPADVMIGIASALKRGQEYGHCNNGKRSRDTSVVKKLENYRCFRNDSNTCSIPCMSSRGVQRRAGNRVSAERKSLFEPPFFEGTEIQDVCRSMIELTTLNFAQHHQLSTDHKKDYSEQGLLCRTSSIGSYFIPYGFLTLLQRTWKLRVVLGKKALLLRLLVYLFVVFFTTSMYSRDIGKHGGCIQVKDVETSSQTFYTATCFTTKEDIENDSDTLYCMDVKPQNSTKQDIKQGSTTKHFNASCFTTKEDIENDTMVVSNIKLIFFFLLFLSLESLLNVTLTFPTEFKLFLHEFRNGWYSTITYFLAKFLVELPGQLVIPTAYAIYFYVYTQQEDFGVEWMWNHSNGTLKGERFKIFLRATYLSGFIAQGLGFLIGILCVASLSRAILLSAGTILGLSFFSGFFKKCVQMTVVERFVTTCSFVRYGLETMLLSIYGLGRCPSPMEAYATESYKLKDNDLFDNWMGLLRLLGITWGLTFIILQLKASKWYLFKLIRKRLDSVFESVKNWGNRIMCDCCQCGLRCDDIRDWIREATRAAWIIVYCIYANSVRYVVIVGVPIVAGLVAITTFIGNWS